MSSSSPARTRQPLRPSRPVQAGSNRPPRVESIVLVVKSGLMIFAAVCVLAASNFLAYQIGRKQVTAEELRRQVQLFGRFVEQKRADDELAATVPKHQQDRFEQNRSALSDLTTSTIKGKTSAAPEPASAGKPVAPPLVDAPALAPLSAATPHRAVHGVAHQRALRKQKGAPPSAGSAAAAMAQQPRDLPAAAPDSGLAGQ